MPEQEERSPTCVATGNDFPISAWMSTKASITLLR